MNKLGEYAKKRRFGKTSEPKGLLIPKTESKSLRFVVQKHQASHLHYDFRLEVDGVLKSWAIPKGPSLDPSQKRLAVMVEDHPLEYKDFEGTIPEGNYGAGSVIIWDEGFYKPIGAFADGDIHKAFQAGIKKGHLVFVLAGNKLNGEFALIKLGNGSKNDWLLVKAKDEYSSSKDILLLDQSVRSNNVPSLSKETPAKLEQQYPDIHKKPMPHNIKPMMATLAEKPFNKKDWIFEIKWDGYRAMTEIEKGKVRIYSRNNKDFNEKFLEIYKSFSNFNKSAIFDGEIVVVDSKGRSDFQLLQDYQMTGKGRLVYYVFDLLYYDGYDLTSLSLGDRRELLKQVLPDAPNIKFSEDIKQRGIDFFKAATKQDLEGIMAKSFDSTYQVGKRVRDWVKIKNHIQQEAIICGFTEPMGSRSDFGALILGTYENEQLTYIGNVGTGFDEKLIKYVMQKMTPLIVADPVFTERIIPNKNITWLKPAIVCEVKLQEWTKEGLMRQPVFLGLREDKVPREVHKEFANLAVSPDDNHFNFTNPDKIFWPKSKITKGELLDYYLKVSKYLVPHLADRPESLNRFPDGISGDHFFQKNIEHPPEWLKTYLHKGGADKHDINYAICNDEKTLTYIINLGCIDLNVWNSRIVTPGNPDYMVLDLDPVNINFKYVLQTALAIKSILEDIGTKSYPKTSGKRGMHIYVPLGAKYSYEQARNFAYLIAIKVNQTLPKITSLERLPENRQGRVYLDYLQNREGATMAAPYSIRPVELASVSTPLSWDEVEKGMKPGDFTIHNIPQRLNEFGDIFAKVLGKGIDLEKSLEKLSKLK